ncbi:MAG TPA: hypothetical protein VIU61_15135 [Kofleriaceae bacterium]
MLRSLFLLALIAGCTGSKQQPSLRVIKTTNHEVVFVQVTNTAKRPMKLSKLVYTFAAGKATVAEGELELYAREIPAGAMAVVEVPLEPDAAAATGPITLNGKLTASVDQIERTYKVTAQIDPEPEPATPPKTTEQFDREATEPEPEATEPGDDGDTDEVTTEDDPEPAPTPAPEPE